MYIQHPGRITPLTLFLLKRESNHFRRRGFRICYMIQVILIISLKWKHINGSKPKSHQPFLRQSSCSLQNGFEIYWELHWNRQLNSFTSVCVSAVGGEKKMKEERDKYKMWYWQLLDRILMKLNKNMDIIEANAPTTQWRRRNFITN